MKRQAAEKLALHSMIALLDMNLYGGPDDGDLFAGILELSGREQNQVRLAMGRELKRLEARYDRLYNRPSKASS